MKKILIATSTLLLSLPVYAQVKREIPIPAIMVVKPAKKLMQDKFVFSGTLVAKDEILVFPEIDGLRITNVLAEEGDRVKKGQVLIRLNDEQLQISLKQLDATVEKAKSGISSAKSTIAQAEAALEEAKLQYSRATVLLEKKDIAPSVYDQRNLAYKTAIAKLDGARDGVKVAEADFNLISAQRNDILLRIQRTEIKAPVDGIISRRTAKIGQTASSNAPNAEPLYRLIANGLIELEGEVLETRLLALKPAQKVVVSLNETTSVTGEIRLIPTEVDRATRLGKIRVSLTPDPALKVGAFARGIATIIEREGLVVPSSAITTEDGQTLVQVIDNGVVVSKKVKPAITQNGLTEILEGLAGNEQVVIRSGPFLREGDKAKAVLEGSDKNNVVSGGAK